MKLLSINSGSSSLKFALIELPSEKTIARGLFEKIGLEDSSYTIEYNGQKTTKKVALVDHSAAVEKLVYEIIQNKAIDSLEEIAGIGHRIAHGGPKYKESVLIDEEVLENITKYSELAPLHNPANVMGIKAFMEVLPHAKNVGVFDTSFHQTMHESEFLYPVPYDWYTKYGIRKYGFHGTSHKFIDKTISEYLRRQGLKVISCHIGNGVSLCAIRAGKVVDTTMGFTPSAGLMMGTRSGEIDAAIIPFVMKKSHCNVADVFDVLNKKSGLLGVSGISSDLRDVEKAASKGDERAILAQEMYAQKIANYIAMYNNLLNGADVIVLTAGVGENSPRMRKLIIERIASLGVKLDAARNDIRGSFAMISATDSKIPVYVVPTNEELMIALETMRLIDQRGRKEKTNGNG